MANSIALDNWVDVYHGNLGIALTDTYTSIISSKVSIPSILNSSMAFVGIVETHSSLPTKC